MASNFLNNSKSRGLRNNNPGNLIRTNNAWFHKIPFSESTDQKFEQFESIEWGIRAYFIDVLGDIKKGANTLVKLINEYAPPTENNTKAYIAAVAKAMGISSTQILTPDKATLRALAKAKFAVELGAEYSNQIKESDYDAAFAVLGRDLEEGTGVCKVCGAVIAGLAVFFFTYFSLIIA